MTRVFEEIAGLPAHPALVHAAVVLAPMLALVAMGYAVLPAVRVHTKLLLAVLAVTAPLSVAVARESGAALRRRLVAQGDVAPGLLEQLDSHETSGLVLLLLVLALGATSFAQILLPTRGRPPLAAVGLPCAVCALSAGVLWSAFETGHSGAVMVWS